MSAQGVFILVNAFGGLVVLGGYGWCLTAYPEYRTDLWGGVHGGLKLLFTISMAIAASGYLTFAYVSLIQQGLDGFGKDFWGGPYTVGILSLGFLLSASVWMPSTIAYIQTGMIRWWIILVLSLWLTSLFLLLITLLVSFSTRENISDFSHYSATAGLAYITIHCLLLDAIVWVLLFKRA